MWGVKSAVWSVKCQGSSGKWKVWSVECEVWSVKFQFGVRRAQCEVWSLKCEVWSVKEAVRSEKCEVWSVKRGVWSFSLECEERSVKCEVWGLECEGSSEKWEVWSVKCGVWSLKFGVRRVQCEVWSVKTLLRLSLKKSNGCRGKDTVGTGCLWTIGHLCLGNFRRRLARVYVNRGLRRLWNIVEKFCVTLRILFARSKKRIGKLLGSIKPLKPPLRSERAFQNVCFAFCVLVVLR